MTDQNEFINWVTNTKGGPGSGNFGHAGRPGKIGGSSPKSTANPGKITNTTRTLGSENKRVKRQFAETVANSYVNQFLSGRKAAGDAIITRDSKGKFNSRSSLDKLNNDEREVYRLQKDMFFWRSQRRTQTSLREHHFPHHGLRLC